LGLDSGHVIESCRKCGRKRGGCGGGGITKQHEKVVILAEELLEKVSGIGMKETQN